VETFNLICGHSATTNRNKGKNSFDNMHKQRIIIKQTYYLFLNSTLVLLQCIVARSILEKSVFIASALFYQSITIHVTVDHKQ